MEYKEALEYIYSRQRFGIKLGLQNIQVLLKGLEKPQKSYPAVLIAGTNGKGSTAAMIASILHRGGYPAGLYTSPHLVKLEERFQVANNPISAEKLTIITEKIKDTVEKLLLRNKLKHQPTFFEVTTAIAFEHFRQEAVDIALLEVGMGGRLDATNAADPLLSIITNIGFDHSRYLGNSLVEIAKEKTGIIRKYGHVVVGRSPEEALITIKNECKKKKTSYILSYKAISKVYLDEDSQYKFNYSSSKETYVDLQVGLKGIHQIDNAAAAICAIECLQRSGFHLSKEHVATGLKDLYWPGRLELINTSPQIWLDGAHNVTAAHCLKEFILNNFNKKIILIFSALHDKDIKGMSETLFPLAKMVVIPKLRSERAEEPQKIFTLTQCYNDNILLVESTEKAYSVALKKAAPQDAIVATGSLYLVGEIKGYIQNGSNIKKRGENQFLSKIH